jgi:ppGpp synthetase/RelA/SpoT-type nucleotidyltranferase
MPVPVDDEYARLHGILTPLSGKVESLIRELVTGLDVAILDVNSRVKSGASAARKIASSSGSYKSYGDLHDMLGVRVITYLASDVDRVVTVLRENFDVDEKRSVDKQAVLDPDQFGYVSYHLVVRLNPDRENLPEWAPYRDLYFEIQIRSILQHAWAEIEHDLGYKSTGGIPAHLRRRFARLAGLLETADSEFDVVTSEIADHVAKVDEVIAAGGDIAIDRDSVSALLRAEGPVSRLDHVIAAAVGARLESRVSLNLADARADELSELGYATIDEVVIDVDSQADMLAAFAINWLNDRTGEDSQENDEDRDENGRYRLLSRGIGLFYLWMHQVLQHPNWERELVDVVDLEVPEVQRALRDIHDTAFDLVRTEPPPPA